jgi:VanZ family protein
MPPNDLPDVKPFAGFDKVVHACMYFGLSILACWTFHAEEKRIRILYVVLFSVSWGMIMEISQLEMMLGRAFDLKDELSNTFGTLLGAAVYMLIASGFRRG